MSDEQRHETEEPRSSAEQGGEAPEQPDDVAEEGAAAPAPSAEEESGGDEPAEGRAAEEAEEIEGPEEEPAAETRTEEKRAEGKAEEKDVIPGADLEPIAVEPATELSAEERARIEAEEEERARREAELAGDGEEPEMAGERAPGVKLESGARYQATGKRKSSIARVILLPGDGKFVINGRALEEFFPRPLHQSMARQPLVASGYEGGVDVRVRVHGGGISGQAGAVRHGIARALTEIDPGLRGDLKRRGFLTRDARVKERRKAGLKKARKRPQFSKR